MANLRVVSCFLAAALLLEGTVPHCLVAGEVYYDITDTPTPSSDPAQNRLPPATLPGNVKPPKPHRTPKQPRTWQDDFTVPSQEDSGIEESNSTKTQKKTAASARKRRALPKKRQGKNTKSKAGRKRRGAGGRKGKAVPSPKTRSQKRAAKASEQDAVPLLRESNPDDADYGRERQ